MTDYTKLLLLLRRLSVVASLGRTRLLPLRDVVYLYTCLLRGTHDEWDLGAGYILDSSFLGRASSLAVCVAEARYSGSTGELHSDSHLHATGLLIRTTRREDSKRARLVGPRTHAHFRMNTRVREFIHTIAATRQPCA